MKQFKVRGSLIGHSRSFSTFTPAIFNTQNSPIFLCNKRIQQLNGQGHIDQARQLFDSMSQRDAFSWNAMIAAYSQHGRLCEARSLFDNFAHKNVRTWTALLSGFAKHGHLDEARVLFESMPERNVVSWNAMMTGYVHNGDLDCARRLFDEMPERNVASWNSIVTGYCLCGQMREARELFDLTDKKNVVSYMAMISGYLEISEYEEAWNVFLMMRRSGVKLDQSIFILGLSAAISLDELELIESIRTLGIKSGYEGDLVVATTILNAYTRNGCLDYAIKFFKMMPECNDYSWTTMISAYSQCGRLDEAIALYNAIPEPLSTTIQTALMTAYAQNGKIHEARRLFESIPNPSVVTWNAMVAGYAQNGMTVEARDIFQRIPERNAASSAAVISGLVHSGDYREALLFFTDAHRSGAVPNQSGFTSALFACANTGSVEMGRQIHAQTIKTRCQYNSYVGNGLISMYGKCKNMEGVSSNFSSLEVQDSISWNPLISRGPSENHMLEDARNTFERMPIKDVVSWTAIISAYEQAGKGDAAFELFLNMLAEGMKPNQSTVASLLSACGVFGATKLGEQIHGLILKLGFDSGLFVCNALITAYFKCGCCLDAFSVFEEMSDRDIITWNAALAGCAQNGLGGKAVKLFEQMKGKGILPNQISFVGILSACSHAGLVKEGRAYFNSMSPNYGITPSVHHYTCMVDLLGRDGQLSEAELLIEAMPLKADAVIWEALLAACKVHRNFVLGQRVAERIFHIGTQKSGTYALLSNMYASQGMWDKVWETRQVMRERGVTKEPGVSWIRNRNELHYFLTGDKTHNQIEEIHSALNELYGLLRAAGYVPDTNFVLHDVEEEQKQNELLFHSEKLAVVYGLLSTPDGAPIQIMKNLRICGDCHSFMKSMSKITERKITIRDGNRFHHFQDGLCSCGDYW